MTSNKVWLHHEPRSFGPGAVARNLEAGLKEIGVEIVKQPGKADFHGCLQNPGNFAGLLPEQTLMGPNLFVVPSEESELCDLFKNFVVPSRWVKDLYEKYPQMQGDKKTIDVWPVGIDTEKWLPVPAEYKTCDFFVYIKNSFPAQAEQVEDELHKHALIPAGTLTYGNYEEEDLKAMCDKCQFAVLVTDTESQGIAYMQILSAGLPCFVIDKTMWTYEANKGVKAPATSVPYFDKRCGIKVPSRGIHGMNDEDISELEAFVDRVEEYTPRNYILENHTLAKSAHEYLRLLKKAMGK